MKKRSVLVLTAAAVCGVIVACTGDEVPEATSSTADGGSSTTTDSGVATPPVGEEDGGLITEGGGGTPEETLDDAGTEPDASVVVDAGDGGTVVLTCGPGSGNGASIQSACSSLKAIVAGGTLTAGTYDLAGFTITGTTTFCSSYTPLGYAGRLDIADKGGGVFELSERVQRTDVLARPTPKEWNATPSGSFLNVSQTCGTAITSKSWGYTVSTSNGKPSLVYTHDSGTATVRYRWVMR